MPELLTITHFVSAGRLECAGEDLLEGLLDLVRDTKKEHALLADYLLTDIGFIPRGDQVEIRLYFRSRDR